MGRIAEESSRNIYLTADNSRSERTETIIEDILSGMKMAHQAHYSIKSMAGHSRSHQRCNPQ